VRPTTFLAASIASSLFAFFKRLGWLGLFLLGIGDSSFLFFPFGNDLLLIALVSSGDSSWAWIPYVIAAACGSVVGVFLVDLLMRKVGEDGLSNFVDEKKLDRIKSKLEDHAGRAVFIGTLLPPPFPFTAVVMVASALQSPRSRILLAVFFGRLLRFTVEALLALWLGRRLIEYLNSDIVEWFVYAFMAIAVVGTAFTVRKWMRGRRKYRETSTA
jgi:membrane protein YqaA with SNARE-associated domain